MGRSVPRRHWEMSADVPGRGCALPAGEMECELKEDGDVPEGEGEGGEEMGEGEPLGTTIEGGERVL